MDNIIAAAYGLTTIITIIVIIVHFYLSDNSGPLGFLKQDCRLSSKSAFILNTLMHVHIGNLNH